MYQDMMKNANNTMLDWEPAVIAQVGGVFLQTHVDGNADLQDMTIGKYISPGGCVGCVGILDMPFMQ
jgi:hypothetical protein